MSALASGIPTSTNESAAKVKQIPGWKQLQKLLPYVARYKKQVVLGLIALAAMGIAGALQPLAFGIIMDCVSGHAQALGRLNQTMPALAHWLTIAYQPSSGRTLAIYCIATLIVVA